MLLENNVWHEDTSYTEYKGRGVVYINSVKNLILKEDGISGCAVLIIIVFVGIAALGGFLYFQFSGIFRLGRETIGQVLTVIDDIEDLEDLKEIEKIEDLKEIEDIGEIEALANLKVEDFEQIKNLAPVIRNIYERIPSQIIDMFQKEKMEEEEIKDEPEVFTEKKITKAIDELLPDSIKIHPDTKIVNYQQFEDVPEMVWDKVEEEYINENTLLLTYQADFPEREIARLRDLEEVSEDIPDEIIKDNKEQLTEIYNIYEIANWYKEKLLAENWEMRGKEIGIEDKLFYQHEQKGYFIFLPPEKFIYTPLE